MFSWCFRFHEHWLSHHDNTPVLFIPPRILRDVRKTGLRGFRPGPTQTGLRNHRRWLETWNFGFRKKRDCTIQVAKTKTLISFAVTAKLICVFVFAYAKIRFFSRRGSFIPPRILPLYSKSGVYKGTQFLIVAHWGGSNVYLLSILLKIM